MPAQAQLSMFRIVCDVVFVVAVAACCRQGGGFNTTIERPCRCGAWCCCPLEMRIQVNGQQVRGAGG